MLVQAWYPTHDNDNDSDTTRYPVIIYSPGLMGSHEDNLMLCHKLASQGYVVVGISHPYVLGTVEFPDGRTASPTLSFSGLDYQQGQDVLTNEMEIWIADIKFVLNQLEQYNNMSGSVLYNKLDMNTIGALGFSFGGATSLQMCRRDNRIKAGINMDGPLNGKNQTAPLHKPFMFLLGEFSETRILDATPMPEEMLKAFGWSRQDEALNMQRTLLPAIDKLIESTGEKNMYKVIIREAKHATFTDSILSEKDKKLSDVISAHIIDFFDTHLKRKPKLKK